MKDKAKSAPPLKEELLPTLRGTLLSWASEGQIKIFLAQPPFEKIEGVSVTRGSTPLLKKPRLRYANPRTLFWPEAGVNAADNFYFGCVVGGQADIRIGVTQRMAARDARLRRGPGYYVLGLEPRILFLIPPGVPVSDGFTPHWERPDLHNAHSQIFWINVRTQGVSIHTCGTRGAAHFNSGAIFIPDTRLLLLAEMLCEEVQAKRTYSQDIARSLLLTMLQRMAQGHAVGGALHSAIAPAQREQPHAVEFTAAHVVQNACRYIRTYSDKPLTLEQIAVQSFVSPTHLNRLFRAQMKTSVMKFTVRCRVEAAQTLLLETNLSAREISQIVGFSHPSHLSQVFARELGIAPTEYRRQHREAEL